VNYCRIIHICLILVVILIKIPAQDVLSSKVVISDENLVKSDYLDEIKVQTGFDLLFSSAISPSDSINLEPGEYQVNQLLDSIFENDDVAYIVKDQLLIISPQAKSRKDFQEKQLIIEGWVITKKDQPIPYAAIYFKRNSKGTIANNDGHFRFLISEEHLEDTLTITSMGYESAEILPEQYLTSELKIELKSISFFIKDVIVRPDDANEIVSKSFQNRNKNYNTSPALLNAFFREASKQDEEYISLTEAIIEISKSSYTNSADDLIRLVKGRNGTNIKESELVNLKVEGGLYNGLRLDIAKYGSYFFGEEMFELCSFRKLKSTVFEERQTYVIGFDMKEGLNISGFKGKLYIDVESYALVRAEFEISPEGLKYARNELVKKTPRGYRAKPVYAKYVVDYRYYDNIWNLYYAHSELKIKVKKERGRENKGFSCDFISTSEFVITRKIENTDKRIRFRDAVGSNDILVEQVKYTTPEFWSNNNVIIPEEPLLITINKLQSSGVIQQDSIKLVKEIDK
jgi:hypothetical protein